MAAVKAAAVDLEAEGALSATTEIPVFGGLAFDVKGIYIVFRINQQSCCPEMLEKRKSGFSPCPAGLLRARERAI